MTASRLPSQKRALAGVELGDEVGVAVQPAVAVQEVGDTPVAKVGRRLGFVDLVVQLE